jgi:hypothetical protein
MVPNKDELHPSPKIGIESSSYRGILELTDPLLPEPPPPDPAEAE